MTIWLEWHEFHYPCGRNGGESAPQFVAYLACPALCDVDISAEVVECLDGLGGYILSRYLCYGYGSDHKRTFNSWHRTVDEAYAAACVWAERRAKEVEVIDPRDNDDLPEWWPQPREPNWRYVAEQHAQYRANECCPGPFVPFGYGKTKLPRYDARTTRVWAKQTQ